jgi:putative membrane protein
MDFLVKVVIQGLGVFITSYLLKEGIYVKDFFTALLVAIILGLVNFLVKPIISLLTLPLNILTLGLFGFIVNGLMVLLVSYFVTGFRVENIWWAVLFSIVLSLIGSLLNALTK